MFKHSWRNFDAAFRLLHETYPRVFNVELPADGPGEIEFQYSMKPIGAEIGWIIPGTVYRQLDRLLMIIFQNVPPDA